MAARTSSSAFIAKTPQTVQSAAGSRVSLSGSYWRSLNFRQERAGIEFQYSGNFDKLDNVQTSFAPFVLGYKRLGSL